MSIDETAKQHFNSGYNCAESVLLAISSHPAFQGRPCTELIPRIATGFGGGLARNGKICGALAGGIIAINLVLGRANAQESRDPCYPAVDKFLAEFQETFQSLNCRDITTVDLKTDEGRRRYQQVYHFEICNPVVAWASRRVVEVIEEFIPGATGAA